MTDEFNEQLSDVWQVRLNVLQPARQVSLALLPQTATKSYIFYNCITLRKSYTSLNMKARFGQKKLEK